MPHVNLLTSALDCGPSLSCAPAIALSSLGLYPCPFCLLFPHCLFSFHSQSPQKNSFHFMPMLSHFPLNPQLLPAMSLPLFSLTFLPLSPFSFFLVLWFLSDYCLLILFYLKDNSGFPLPLPDHTCSLCS